MKNQELLAEVVSDLHAFKSRMRALYYTREHPIDEVYDAIAELAGLVRDLATIPEGKGPSWEEAK